MAEAPESSVFLVALFGFCFGFVGSVPVAGPIAVLVLSRGLEERHRAGLLIAVGAAIAEGFYAFLAFYGFGALLSELSWITPVSRGAGAIILLVLGVVFLRTPRPRDAGRLDARPVGEGRRAALLGFTVTAMNPTLIATWTAAVTTLFGTGWITFSPRAAAVFGGGAMLGIVAWFATLLTVIRKLNRHFQPSLLERVRRAMGVFLLLLSGYFAAIFIAYFVK